MLPKKGFMLKASPPWVRSRKHSSMKRKMPLRRQMSRIFSIRGRPITWPVGLLGLQSMSISPSKPSSTLRNASVKAKLSFRFSR